MRGIISQFLLFFFFVLMIWSGVTYVSLNMNYCGAKKYFEMVRNQIENSDFEQSVINGCIAKAKQQGYWLSVLCYGERKKDAKITLQFEYVFPMIKEKRSYTIDGYAR